MVYPNLTIHFTAKDGSEATITGNYGAIEAIEDIFEKVGIKYNDEVGCWDMGYYGKPKRTANSPLA